MAMKALGQADTYELTAQLRNRGYAVCVWTYEDVLDECGGDRNKAEAWLLEHRKELEDAMCRAGYMIIGTYFPDHDEEDT